MSAFASPRFENAEPMLEMNTTPLIDVMLVLIIMFIITIPPQGHAVKLDLPSGGSPQVEADKNKLIITSSGALLFNGRAVNRTQLAEVFADAGQREVQPELHLQPAAEAPYAVVDDVLVLAKKAHLTRIGFVGNEAYRNF